MNLEKITDPEIFLNALRGANAKRGSHELMLGICHTLMEEPEVHRQYHLYHAGNSFFALWTPPFPITLYHTEDIGKNPGKLETALKLLTGALIAEQKQLPGVNGQNRVAQLFAKTWSEANNVDAVLNMKLRSFVLDKVPPQKTDVPGFLQKADLSHMPLIFNWMDQFNRELGDVFPDSFLQIYVPSMIQKGRAWLWMVKTPGEPPLPVSMIFNDQPTGDGIFINFVFTAPEHRKQGYAGACVRTLCQNIAGKEYQYITLFTDLANPASNLMYQKIGFQAVDDFQEFLFRKK